MLANAFWFPNDIVAYTNMYPWCTCNGCLYAVSVVVPLLKGKRLQNIEEHSTKITYLLIHVCSTVCIYILVDLYSRIHTCIPHVLCPDDMRKMQSLFQKKMANCDRYNGSQLETQQRWGFMKTCWRQLTLYILEINVGIGVFGPWGPKEFWENPQLKHIEAKYVWWASEDTPTVCIPAFGNIYVYVDKLIG